MIFWSALLTIAALVAVFVIVATAFDWWRAWTARQDDDER